jgi:tyrosyl-tRNA synthetase
MNINDFSRGLEEVIPEIFIETLKTNKKLKIKFGADPSAPDLHLGHLVVLNKLKMLQSMGHEIIFLIGDFTALIGDPTGKSETRKSLTTEQVKLNSNTYQDQIFKILDKNKTKVVFNSDWLSKLSSSELIMLSAKYTVARMLEREDFQNRFKNQKPISIHEFLYPLLQGYDSVHLNNDIEIGGTDQKFNMLMGRHLQKEFGKKQQAIITLPILEGLDGIKKMSKSLGNHIGLLEDPNNMFGKIMSIPDKLIFKYYSLLTDISETSLEEIKTDLKSGKNPKLIKEDLGVFIVTKLHNATAAEAAKANFNKVFSNKENPDEMPAIKLKEPVRIDQFLFENKILQSKKEAVRMVKQGAVSLDGEKITDPFLNLLPLETEKVLKVGKRKFYRIS